MTFAQRLAEARKQAGLTIEEVAVATGYGYHSIYSYERGRNTPPERARQPILDAIQRATDDGRFEKTKH